MRHRPKRNRFSIAFCGSSGRGKSSLINRLRDLPDPPRDQKNSATHDPFAPAPTGIVEVTCTCHAYTSPYWNNAVDLYDLPGVGTSSYPRETYCEKVDLFSYDFHVVVVERWQEDDVWLTSKLRAAQKPFLIVRTMVDQALRSEVERERRNGRAPDVERLRQLVEKTIRRSITAKEDVHVVCALPNTTTKRELAVLRTVLNLR